MELVDINGEIEENAPKSDAGNRLVALDGGTVKVIKRHNKRQRQAREEAGAAWVESGRLFTRPNGEWVEPTWLSDYFDRLVKRLGLPPIRLHDLRHGAATMALKAGAKMKVVQKCSDTPRTRSRRTRTRLSCPSWPWRQPKPLPA
ncbi:hypothetical protein AB0H28_17595 [Micromonospora sp. NPDC050980]|uniref:hypothetical protein n=1 Tax=Micromonospora sp. NPDC050980 TaxID=3155161 RepID=UPI0033C79649